MFNVGDTVKLTGTHWDDFDLKDDEVTITSISSEREPFFIGPDGRGYVIFIEGDVDYSATLVQTAEATAYPAAERAVAQLRFYIGNLRNNLETGILNSRAQYHKGRLVAYEDALQMLTGSRGEDIK